MKLVLIPPGEFEMGSSREEVERLVEEARRRTADQGRIDLIRSESPRHRVKITKAFCLGLCEVTQAEYQRVMGSNPSQFKGDPNRPVEKLTWDEALEFCRKLSDLPSEKAEGIIYRLPTEAEWEYACRAGTTTRYSFGDDEALLGQYAWWSKNSQGRTRPVGRLRANGFGLFDMHGNVWECCADSHAAEYYATSPGEDPTGPASGAWRVARGGSCRGDYPGFFRCAYRRRGQPVYSYNDRGFRVARTLAP